MAYIPKVFIKQQSYPMFYLNTGTSLDINTGSFNHGITNIPFYKHTGQYYLNGGISPTFAVVGKAQTYKSATCISYVSRALKLYKDSFLFVYDTEFAIAGKERILNLSSELDSYLGIKNPDQLSSRIELQDKSTMEMEDFYETIKDIANERIKHQKDLLVETPFLDPKSNKPMTMLCPMIVLIDSFSLMQSKKETELFEKHKLTDSELNTISMNDAKHKANLMRQLTYLSRKAGIYFILTAHLGKKLQLNPYEGSSKDLQYMSINETVKHVGSQFGFLVNTLLKANKVTNLLDSKKEVLYPPDFKVPSKELNECNLIVCRCKNNISGISINPILSQYFGILEGLTNYHILKTSPLNKDLKLYGMEGNNIHHTLKILQDYKLSRTKIRTLLNDSYELYRALEIISQIYFIYTTWPLNGYHTKILNSLSIDDISNKLVKNKSLVISDILNSRGYWTYDKKDPRKYLSIFDILELLHQIK